MLVLGEKLSERKEHFLWPQEHIRCEILLFLKELNLNLSLAHLFDLKITGSRPYFFKKAQNPVLNKMIVQNLGEMLLTSAIN